MIFLSFQAGLILQVTKIEVIFKHDNVAEFNRLSRIFLNHQYYLIQKISNQNLSFTDYPNYS